MTTQQSARVAVVGSGYWGKNLVRNFAELGALEAIVDLNKAAVDALIAQHGGRALSFDAALADPAIKGIALATPAETHHGLAKKALLAGKDVYVEKPLALEIAHAEDLVATAKKAGRRLMVGHLLQYHPAFLALMNVVRSGRLGRLSYVYSNRLSMGKIRREEDVLWSFAPHDFSMMLAVTGEEPDFVGSFNAPTLHPSIGDMCQVHLTFPNGMKGHVFVSWLHPIKEQRFVVIGERGSIVFEDSQSDPAKKLVFYPHSIDWAGGAPTPSKGDAEPIPYDSGEPLKLECQHFLDCINAASEPRTDGREGLAVLRVLARATGAIEAARHPAPVKVETPRVAKAYPGVTIHESAYVDAGVEIGEGSKIWHFSHILGSVTLGRNVNVGQNVVIGPNVTVGNNVKIQNNVSLYKGVILEDGVFCGPSCVFTNVNNPRAEIVRMNELRTTLVKRGASIGANATIVCGYTLGEYSFIAAGAVVATDVPPFALMAGVPAKRIGWMSHDGMKLGADLVCPASGRKYREVSKDQLEEIVE